MTGKNITGCLDERCRLYCQSKETGAVVSMNRMVHDGTACSYSDAYSVCVRGECEHVGCDSQIASDKQEDRCGVCGGDNRTCKIIRGNFTRSSKKPGYLKILEIPKGARHLLVQEFKGSPHVLAVKNQETGHLFLNDEHELPASRVVIEGGVAWEYRSSEEAEAVQTTGPLKYPVLLMVRSHSDAKVTLSYRYVIQDQLRSLDSNLLQEDAVFYEWALKKWSQCSKPCGGGKQYTRFGCRRKADGKTVPRTLCSNVNKPRAIGRSCNTDTCSSPRWVTGDWEDCTASCGQIGWQRRWVSCQPESSRGQQQEQQKEEHQKEQQQRSVHSKLCRDPKPEGKRTCNRFPCPTSWRAGPWTPCSVSCGNGTQERQVVCSSPEKSAGNCSEPPPITTRSCRGVSCNGDQKNTIIQWLSRSNPESPAPKIPSRHRCRGDRSVFCRMEALTRYCSNPGYRLMCCKSCSKGNISSTSSATTNSSSWTSATETVTSVTSVTSATTPTWSDSSHIISDIISDIISTTSSFTAVPSPTTRGSSDFIYVDYDDYDEYSSYEDPLGRTPPPPPTMTTAPPTSSTSSSTRRTHKTAPPYLFRRKTTPAPPAISTLTIDGTIRSMIRTSGFPDSPPPTSADPDDIVTLSSSWGGQSLQTIINVTETEAAPTAVSSFVPLMKKDNNSVDEVRYRIVGLDRDQTRDRDPVPGQHQQAVKRMPPFRERTQNKRIQELLNEKRRQNLLRRANGKVGGA